MDKDSVLPRLADEGGEKTPPSPFSEIIERLVALEKKFEEISKKIQTTSSQIPHFLPEAKVSIKIHLQPDQRKRSTLPWMLAYRLNSQSPWLRLDAVLIEFKTHVQTSVAGRDNYSLFTVDAVGKITEPRPHHFVIV